jgi:hypothetical protein
MKIKNVFALATASFALVSTVPAISLDDIQIWTGSGTNRAALVIEWNSPIVFNNSTVAAPIANKTLVWGYRFNGTATGIQMFNAILGTDPRLYAVESVDEYGNFIEAIGYNLKADGLFGVTDGTNSFSASAFVNGAITNPVLDVDAASPLHSGDLFWSGLDGPNWSLWNELGDSGGFSTSPDRGSSQYWTPTDLMYYSAGAQGQWELAQAGLNSLALTNGSWIGFSVAAAGYDANPGDPATTAFDLDEQAPPSPDGTYVAYVCNTNDFAVQIISTNNIDTASPYNDPTAILNRPTLQFFDPYDGDVTDRVSIIDPPYNLTPAGSKVITEIKSGGQITVEMGRKIYDDPNNPYGTDLIVYGNSFFSAFGTSGTVSDETDLNTATLSSGIYGHATIVSVSQDGINWYTYGTTSVLFPDNAFRWDDPNASWTYEQMNPTKPLNPFIYTNNFAGQTVASGLDQFIGAAGGTGYDLKASGFPWIQYVRVQPGPGTYTVIDAIAAVDPVVVGDALSITPDNLASGITNLVFQAPYNTGQSLISINFDSVSQLAKVSTVGLSEFSSFALVPGVVASAYQIKVAAVPETNGVAYQADIGLSVGTNYTGNGDDLCVLQWNGTNWCSPPFSFNAANQEVFVAGLTNLSAFVVTQLPRPELSIQASTPGNNFQFTPSLYLTYILERSLDLVTWSPVCTNTPANTQHVTLQDPAQPPSRAFYRLQVHP